MNKNKLTRILAGIFILFTFTSCVYHAKKSQKLLAKAATQSYDLIVVPGIAYDSTGWTRIMKARVYWSKYLYDKGIAKNIMYSGSAVYTKYCEADIMAMYAEFIGIPKEHIFVERKAEHSTENIYYSYKKAKKMNFDKIALATDPFQAKMLSRFIKNKVSKEIGIIPVNFDILKTMESTMVDQPKIDIDKAIVENFISIKERESFFKRLKGTNGKNLKKDIYDTEASM